MNQRSGRATSWGLVLGLATATVSQHAWAGGFEEPGLGAEAMGRGGTFTAKADDGTALEYNIAGFARQRGTRLTIEGRLSLTSQSFTRAGEYPGTTTPYPMIHDTNGVSAAPLVAISTDFDYFDRWTFFVGLTTPSAADADRTFAKTVNGLPSPGRYDLQEANLVLAYPMLGAAARVTKWLDIGLAVQMAYGSFDLKSTAAADLSGLCGGSIESGKCDIGLDVKTKGFTATGVFGAMVHPVEGLHIGVNLRGPFDIKSSGTVAGTAPPAEPTTQLNASPATLPFHLPWVLRFGIRYAFLDSHKFEKGDIELDGDYETWHQAQGNGDVLSIPNLGPFSNEKVTLVHHYKDTGSVRVGGAWNILFKNDSVLSVRGGVFFDSAATSTQWTRIDFDTMSKLGLCLGLGYKISGFKINIAYNYIAAPSRTVDPGEGHQQLINPVSPNQTSLNNGQPTDVINDGKYSASTHVILLGLGFHFEDLAKRKRVLKYD